MSTDYIYWLKKSLSPKRFPSVKRKRDMAERKEMSRCMSMIGKLFCWFGWHKNVMGGGGYQDIGCRRCGLWWDEQ